MSSNYDFGIKFNVDSGDVDKNVQKVKKGIESLQESVVKLSAAFAAVSRAGEYILDFAQKAAAFNEVRSYFKGTNTELELFQKATKETVSRGDLIRMSNQMTDLGISMKKQTILFALAKNASDAYGTSLEDGMSKVIMASNGSQRALAKLGISVVTYKDNLEQLIAQAGRKLDLMSAEEQQLIKMEALVRSSNMTLAEATANVKSQNDQLQALVVTYENAKIEIGQYILNGLSPLLEAYTKSDKATQRMITGIAYVGQELINQIPAILQFITMLNVMRMSTAAVGTAADVTVGKLLSLKNIAKVGLVGIAAVLAVEGVEWLMERKIREREEFERKMWEKRINLLARGKGIKEDLSSKGLVLELYDLTDERLEIEMKGLLSKYTKQNKTHEEVYQQIDELNELLKRFYVGTKQYRMVKNKIMELSIDEDMFAFSALSKTISPQKTKHKEMDWVLPDMDTHKKARAEIEEHKRWMEYLQSEIDALEEGKKLSDEIINRFEENYLDKRMERAEAEVEMAKAEVEMEKEKWRAIENIVGQFTDVIGDHIYNAFTGQNTNIIRAFKHLLARMTADLISSGLLSLIMRALNPSSSSLGLFGVLFPSFAGGVENIRGLGTATSDSIPARLSAGESVLTAGATKYIQQTMGEGWITKLNKYTSFGKSYVANGYAAGVENLSPAFSRQEIIVTREIGDLYIDSQKIDYAIRTRGRIRNERRGFK